MSTGDIEVIQTFKSEVGVTYVVRSRLKPEVDWQITVPLTDDSEKNGRAVAMAIEEGIKKVEELLGGK